MPTTSAQYVDALATVSGFATTTWTSQANALDTSESTAATFALGANTTDYGSFFSFNASDFTGIPPGSTITGITVTVRIENTGTANRLTAFARMDSPNATAIGSEVALNGGSAISNTAGGTEYANLTGTSAGALPTRAQLTSGNFGIRLRMRRTNTVTASLYSIKATVDYTPIQGASAVSGTGSLTASGTRLVSGSANLVGSGALAASGTRLRSGAASLAGSGALAASGVRIRLGATALSGVGALLATGTRSALGGAGVSGSGALSASGNVVAGGGGWGAPQNLIAAAVSTSQIDLTWDEVDGASGYDVERDGVIVAQDVADTTYSDTGLGSSTLYTYRVRAVAS